MHLPCSTTACDSSRPVVFATALGSEKIPLRTPAHYIGPRPPTPPNPFPVPLAARREQMLFNTMAHNFSDPSADDGRAGLSVRVLPIPEFVNVPLYDAMLALVAQQQQEQGAPGPAGPVDSGGRQTDGGRRVAGRKGRKKRHPDAEIVESWLAEGEGQLRTPLLVHCGYMRGGEPKREALLRRGVWLGDYNAAVDLVLKPL